jgi:hypothetical protein
MLTKWPSLTRFVNDIALDGDLHRMRYRHQAQPHLWTLVMLELSSSLCHQVQSHLPQLLHSRLCVVHLAIF